MLMYSSSVWFEAIEKSLQQRTRNTLSLSLLFSIPFTCIMYYDFWLNTPSVHIKYTKLYFHLCIMFEF